MIKETQAHRSFAMRMVLAQVVVCVIAIASVCSARQNSPLLQIHNSSGRILRRLCHLTARARAAGWMSNPIFSKAHS